jgi:TRAP-type transport system small permease protein
MSEPSTPQERARETGFIARLGRLQLWLAALAILAMMLVTVADVVMRYAFNNPVRGTYDFTEAMLVVFVFCGMAVCFLARANIVIDLIDSLVGRRTQSVLRRCGDVLSVAMLVVLVYAAWTPATQAYSNGERKLQLDLPLWILWAVALLGLLVAIVCAASMLFPDRRSRNG